LADVPCLLTVAGRAPRCYREGGQHQFSPRISDHRSPIRRWASTLRRADDVASGHSLHYLPLFVLTLTPLFWSTPVDKLHLYLLRSLAQNLLPKDGEGVHLYIIIETLTGCYLLVCVVLVYFRVCLALFILFARLRSVMTVLIN
jgi:hypothetical protein